MTDMPLPSAEQEARAKWDALLAEFERRRLIPPPSKAAVAAMMIASLLVGGAVFGSGVYVGAETARIIWHCN